MNKRLETTLVRYDKKIKMLEEKIRKEECDAIKNLYIAVQNDFIIAKNKLFEKNRGLTNSPQAAQKLIEDNVIRRENLDWLKTCPSMNEVVAVRKYFSLDKLTQMCKNIFVSGTLIQFEEYS